MLSSTLRNVWLSFLYLEANACTLSRIPVWKNRPGFTSVPILSPSRDLTESNLCFLSLYLPSGSNATLNGSGVGPLRNYPSLLLPDSDFAIYMGIR